MKNKKKLLLITGILLLVIGISFAYYVIRISYTGDTSEVEIQTAIINDIEVYVEGNIDLGTAESEYGLLPGHKSVSKIKVYTDIKNVTANYNLIWTGTNELNTPLNYTVYRTYDDINVSMSCEEKDEYVIGGFKLTEECTMNNESSLGEAIATGTIPSTSTTSKVILKEAEKETSNDSGLIAYYYVVLEFPNLDEEQTDEKKSFNGIISIESVDSALRFPTYNVSTALGTLAVYEGSPDYSYRLYDAEKGGYCYYGDEKINLGYRDFNFEENCSTIYKVAAYNYSDDYADDLVYEVKYYDNTFNNGYYEYVGTGTWNAENSTCEFNGNAVYYWNYINSNTLKQEDCGDIYYSDEDGDYFGGIEKMDEPGVFKKFTTNYGVTGIYEAKDDLGKTYYYRGNVDNNYVKFAGFYWRIIRINGNGSIRMIYAGNANVIDALANREEVLANGYDDENTKYTQIGESKFNESKDQAEYVGFKYTLGSVHGTGTKSTILEAIESWYTSEDNELQNYEEHLDIEAGFCGDRSAYIDSSGTEEGGGTGTTVANFGAYTRLSKDVSNDNPMPTFKCPNYEDLYTTSSSSIGNKSLDYPIGLITADEVVFAGNTSRIRNFLSSGNIYWTITPDSFYGNNACLIGMSCGAHASVARVYPEGYLVQRSASSQYSYGVRPVINLKTDNLTIIGSGTIGDPYVVS